MTVKELIEELQKVPQDAEVKYYDGDNGWMTVEEVEFTDEIVVNVHARDIDYANGNFAILIGY